MTQAPQARRLTPADALEGVAAVCVAAIVAVWLYSAPLTSAMQSIFGGQNTVMDVSIVVAALAAVVTAWICSRITVVARGGAWLVAAAGTVLFTVTLLIIDGLQDPGILMILLLATGGIALGGVSLALAQASSTGRLVIAAGTTVGLVLSFPLRILFSTMDSGYLPGYSVLTVVVVATAVLVWLPHRAAEAAPATRTPPGLMICTVICGLVLWLGSLVQVAAIMAIGSYTQPRRELSEQFTELSAYALAILLTLVLAGFAYRRGRIELTRWTVLCLGLTCPLVVLSRQSEIGNGSVTSALLIAGFAAAAGVLAARFIPEALPWDAIGVATAALGMYFSTATAQHLFPGVADIDGFLMTFGSALALGSGLAGMYRDIPAAERNWWPLGAAYGIAVTLLTGHALAQPVLLFTESPMTYGELPPMGPPLLSGLTALAVAGLFGLRKLLGASRRQEPAPTHTP